MRRPPPRKRSALRSPIAKLHDHDLLNTAIEGSPNAMRTRPPLQPDSFPIAGGPAMAMDAALPKRRITRDADPDAALEAAAAENDPRAALLVWFDGLLGADHEHRSAFQQMLARLAGSSEDTATEDRKRAMDARPRSYADRIRDAEITRRSEARAALSKRFPDFDRIRSA